MMHVPVLLLYFSGFTFGTEALKVISEDAEDDHVSCPGLVMKNNVEYQCRLPDGSTNSCNTSSIPPFTVAAGRCTEHYKSTTALKYRYMRCKLDGTWSSNGDLSCIPDCGRAGQAKKLVKSGEVTSEPGRWPWHIAMYWKSDEGTWEYVCGGSLISKNAVITAAHCVTTPLSETPVTYENITVQAGKYWRQYNHTDKFTQTREVANVIVHPNYSGTTFDSDVALVILKSPVKFTSRISPVCYSTIGNTLLEEYQLQSGNIGTVIGWGVTETGRLSDSLHEADLPVISYKECTESYQLFFQSYGRSTNFCAGYLNGTRVCSGDSGGGMVFPSGSDEEQRWYLQGVVSVGVPDPLGLRKCNPHVYALFTRVGRYSEWIARVLDQSK